MIIKWLDDAIYDLKALREYIAKDKSIAADRVAKRTIRSFNFLVDQPLMGRLGRIANTRELIGSGTPYIVPYPIKDETMEILRVFHSAMQWKDDL